MFGEIPNCINNRQLERLTNHAAFMEEYQAKRRRNLGYLNVPLGFPVMTRQEINLSIPIVTQIQKTGECRFRVQHKQFDGSVIPQIC